MAKLTVSGLGDVINSLNRYQRLTAAKLAKTMLKQGSVPVAEEWKKGCSNESQHALQSAGQTCEVHRSDDAFRRDKER